MVKNCILHIGMNKTGSSAIQNYLYKNDISPSFYYIDFGTPNHSSAFLSLFSEHPEKMHDNVKRGLNQQEIEEIRQRLEKKLVEQLRKEKAENYIFSGEGILHLNENELQKLKSFLQEYFSTITVVAYVREPRSFMESLYQQCLKGGLVNDFSVQRMYPRYKQKFVKFFNVFGDENIRLWEYNKDEFQDRNIVHDFCSKLGITYNGAPLDEVNSSLSVEATALLYVNRKFFPYGTGENAIAGNQRMIKALRSKGADKFEIHYSVIESILAQKKNDIAWMEQKLGTKFNIKTTSSPRAVKSEDDLFAIAGSVFDKSESTADIQEIAERVDGFKVRKKELCVLHIGMPKTGSTSIQKELYNHIEDERAVYANLEDPNHGIALISMFMKEPLKHHYFRKRGWTQKDIDAFNLKNKALLVKGFKDLSTSVEIISGEDIFHFPKPVLMQLKKFLDQYFENILVVGYVRPPKSFMESAFQQLVKFNNLGSFDFSIIYHSYRKFAKFDDIFGKENVKLVKFDPKVFPENDILLDFYEQITLKGCKSRLKKANETLSQEVVSVLFTYHYFGSKVDFGSNEVPIEHKLITLLGPIGETKFHFSSALIDKVLKENAVDLNWIEKRMGITLKEPPKSGGIDSEADLLWYAMKSIPTLKELLGEEDAVPEENFQSIPADIVLLIDALKTKLVREMGLV